MAFSINRVVIVGNLTRDAELKYTNSGAAICKFSIAVNRSRKSGDQWTEEVNFFDVDLWGRSGEAIAKYLVKGKQVGIDGELRQDRWEQDGQKRSKVKIAAFNVQLLGGGRPGADTGPSDYGDLSARPAGESFSEKDDLAGQTAKPTDNFEDDIPF